MQHESGVVIETYVGNITDEAALAEAFAGAEAVIHAAALIDTRRGAYVMALLSHVNITGTACVVRACNAMSVKRLVLVSSGAACFRHCQLGKCDTTTWDERNADFGLDVGTQVYPYGRTKAASELIVKHANGDNGLLTVCVRPYYIFGNGDITTKMMLKTGKPTPLFGSAVGEVDNSASAWQ